MENSSIIDTTRHDTTIVVPIYNVEKYLPECIDSVINQTYPDLQIILVDDGSTDSSGKICDDYAKKDSRISVIHKTNGGPSDARNAGLSQATGKYIYFLDSDDYIEPETIEILYTLCEENKLDIISFDSRAFIQTGFSFYAEAYSHVRKGSYPNVLSGPEMYMELLSRNDYSVSVPMHFFNREFLTANNLNFLKGVLHEDHLFIFIALLKAKRVMTIPDILFNRRYRPKSIMTTSMTQKNSDSMYIILQELLATHKHFHDEQFTKSAYEAGVQYIAGVYAQYYADTLKLQDNKGRQQFSDTITQLKSLGYVNYKKVERRVTLRYIYDIKAELDKIPAFSKFYNFAKPTAKRILSKLIHIVK